MTALRFQTGERHHTSPIAPSGTLLPYFTNANKNVNKERKGANVLPLSFALSRRNTVNDSTANAFKRKASLK